MEPTFFRWPTEAEGTFVSYAAKCNHKPQSAISVMGGRGIPGRGRWQATMCVDAPSVCLCVCIIAVCVRRAASFYQIPTTINHQPSTRPPAHIHIHIHIHFHNHKLINVVVRSSSSSSFSWLQVARTAEVKIIEPQLGGALFFYQGI